MRRITIALMGLAMAAVPAASASADDTLSNYDLLRDHLKTCVLDTTWSQLSEEARADCNNLFRDYVLFYQVDDATLYVHCRSSSRCIPTPEGMPSASGPIPQDSTVYDVQPRDTTAAKKAKAAAHRRNHRHSHHHR